MTVHSPFDELAPELKGPTPFGQSLLYPFDKNMPRNCGTLKIPFEFCQCQLETKNITETEQQLGKLLAQAMVGKMNADMVEKNGGNGGTGDLHATYSTNPMHISANEQCVPLEVNPFVPIEIIEYEPEKQIDVFKAREGIRDGREMGREEEGQETRRANCR